ncbi:MULTISPECIES: LBL_2463 family protein [Leptospira]|uniref:GNAT family N-acetyltransferase n=1 Tax=Leptospira santarosai str. ZUN179 TaxID=1049985 RepID=M6UL18_9LEPT|nr:MULTISPECIES: hypothetical protein [Leptospira]EKO79170.1 hypothetical protein LEP1GSC068_0461 [Leptospira sp. Fiocruz LV3954]EMI69503.1 hypothetical protein LEP1GSC076_0220 [Leptospira sp. Fiocruz LV4135]EMO45817.1 hypothetical protein LEP1GSC187_2812 [Leptospira santarosai str. ZUN179]MDI7158054.1 hypothetical protein [Leptospira santarosai]MDI7182907.1 hypothetical protein [Leptospira santarosai]
MIQTIETLPQSQKTSSKLNGFQLFTWDSSQDKEKLNPVKEFCKQIYTEAGYSDYETIDLDNWSKWFYVTYDGHLQAATRIVEKTNENLIPLEIVKRFPSGKHYNVNYSNIADWNSVSFKQTILGAQAFKIVACNLAKYCLDRKFSIVYGLINPIWKGLQRVYFDNGAIISEVYSDLVYYPGCFLNGELALFKLIEIRENALQNIAAKL